MKDLIGNIYENMATGNQWQLVAVNGRLLTLQSPQGNKFNTSPELMGNYRYIGTNFIRR